MRVLRVVLTLLFFGGFITSALAQALRPGDTIQISVWQDPKLDRQVVVGPGGTISFPLAGHIRAAGMTPQALENVLRSRLQKNYTGQLDITVSYAAVRKKEDEDDTKPRVYVTGEVLRPGPYIIRPRTSVMQAIALAGGLGPFAASQRIQVRRKIGGIDTIFKFNYRAYESGRDLTNNINVRSGDVIIVPERGLLE